MIVAPYPTKVLQKHTGCTEFEFLKLHQEHNYAQLLWSEYLTKLQEVLCSVLDWIDLLTVWISLEYPINMLSKQLLHGGSIASCSSYLLIFTWYNSEFIKLVQFRQVHFYPFICKQYKQYHIPILCQLVCYNS